jgi:hypothetical protein
MGYYVKGRLLAMRTTLAAKDPTMSPRAPEPGGTLWELRAWRCVFSGTAVLLYAGDTQVASVYANGRREVESIAGKWQRAVEAIVRLEKPAESSS